MGLGLAQGRCGGFLELDDNFKRLIKELGFAINESVSESERIADVVGRIRNAGYDLYLVLEVTIGLNKRDGEGPGRAPERGRQTEFRLSYQDAQFLRSLKISVEDK